MTGLEETAVLNYLAEIVGQLKHLNSQDPGALPIDEDYRISDIQGFPLDYKGRKHLYAFCPNALTLLLNDIGGQIAVSANTWTDISYRPGLWMFTTGYGSTPTLIKVRATNETISGASSGGGASSAITAAAGSYAVGFSTEITEMAADTDEIVTAVNNIPAQGQALAGASMPVVLPASQITTLTPPAALTNYALETGGNLATLAGGVAASVYQENLKQVGGSAIALGQTTMAGSLPVAIASNQGALTAQGPVASGSGNGNNPVKIGGVFNTTQPTVTNGQVVDLQATARGAAIVATGVDALVATPATSATGTKTNVSGAASSTSLLSSNTSRKGAMFYNDSTAILYIDLSGGTASTTSYSHQIAAQGMLELLYNGFIYTGAITGIWSAANGAVRITEFS